MDKNIVSEVTFYPLRITEKGLIGFGGCVFEERLSLNSIAIYTKPDGSGIRCLFPVKAIHGGKEIGIYYPIDSLTYNAITTAIEKKVYNVTKMRRNDERYYPNI